MINVLALVPSIPDTIPGQRYRIEQWESRLSRLGVSIRFEAFDGPELNSVLYKPGNFLRKLELCAQSFRRRLDLLASIREYDVVYIFREAAMFGPALIERRIHRLGVPMIFDFDDATFIRYISPSNGLLSLLKCAGKTRTLCRIAAHVMAGNRHLANYAARFNRNVTIVPTTIDTDKYVLAPRRDRQSPLVIGWTGSYSTLQHLDVVKGPLRRLAQSEDFRLRIIGTEDYRLEGVQTEAIPWRSESEVADLRPVDIGIMPLPDNRWTRGKCACKALQYMGLGIPTICSPIGVNTEIIQDGINGYLAGDEDQWVDRLTRLLHSSELRNGIGLAGRATVESGFSARVQAPRVYEILNSVKAEAGLRAG